MSVHYQRGLLLFERDRYEEAGREFLQALAESPNDAWTLGDLGLTAALRDRYEEAENWAGQSIAADPSYAKAHFSRGSLLQKKGANDGAMEAYYSITRGGDLRSVRTLLPRCWG